MSAALGFLRGELCRLPRRLCRLLPLLLLLAAASLAALAAVSAGAGQKESALRLALVDKDDSFHSRCSDYGQRGDRRAVHGGKLR